MPTPPRIAVLVDDEAAIRELARRILAAAGWVVVEASNGAEALQVLEQRPDVSLLVTDIQMPEMSGLELAAAVRAMRRQIKILYLTGYSDRVFESGAVLPDGEAFLEKPFTPAGLHEAIALLVFGSVGPSASVSGP